MEMLRKIIDYESLENFPKNLYNGVCFNKIASLRCTNCNCIITRIHQKLFLEYVPKKYIQGSTKDVSPRGFCKITLNKSAKYLSHSLSYKAAVFQSIDCKFTEKQMFNKNI